MGAELLPAAAFRGCENTDGLRAESQTPHLSYQTVHTVPCKIFKYGKGIRLSKMVE